MKKLSFLLLLAVIGLAPVSAQKQKVTTGALNFDQGRYDDAIVALEEGLSNPDLFKKPRDMAKGQYYLAKAYYMALGSDELMAKYPDAALKAKKALDDLTANPEGELYQNRALIEGMSNNIWGQLYNKGVSLFNDGADDEALAYFTAARDLSPDHFLTNRMLASTHLAKLDTTTAVEVFEASIVAYNKKYVEVDQAQLATQMEDTAFTQMADLDKNQLSYVVRQLAVLYEADGETDKALATLEAGGKVLPDDADIRLQQLGIYQNHPNLYDQAVGKFQAQIAADPKNNAVRLAFASMQERAGKLDEALALYQEAYDLDPQSLQANYGMAAIRINKAAELSEQKMASNSDNDIERLNGEIKELCNQAYPYLVWLHNAQPEESEWLVQLVNITPIIGKSEEMLKWAEKLGEMRRAGN